MGELIVTAHPYKGDVMKIHYCSKMWDKEKNEAMKNSETEHMMDGVQFIIDLYNKTADISKCPFPPHVDDLVSLYYLLGGLLFTWH